MNVSHRSQVETSLHTLTVEMAQYLQTKVSDWARLTTLEGSLHSRSLLITSDSEEE